MRSGTMVPKAGSSASGTILLPLSLIMNFILVLLCIVINYATFPEDQRLDSEAALLARQPSAVLDLHRVTEHLYRVNNQMQENVALLKGAQLSLEESLVLEEMRGLSAEEVKKVLQNVRGSLGAPNLDGALLVTSNASLSASTAGSIAFRNRSMQEGNLTKKWLAIGIPTVPRAGNENYLTRTVETLLDELPTDESDPLFAKVLITIMNMEGENHTAFRNLRIRFEQEILGDLYAKKANTYVRFLELQQPFLDPTPEAPEPDPNNNPHDLPGRVARKQTSDVLNLMKSSIDLGDYFMFMEDDFETCPHSIYHLLYALRKLNTMQKGRGWLALRMSYGMNGVLLRSDDVHRFSEFAHENKSRKPIDLLWQEFVLHNTEHTAVLTRGRDQYIYRFNLFSHIGEVSSFPDRPVRGKWPQCYELMTRAWSLQENEQFDKKCLDISDFTPCLQTQGRQPGHLNSRIGETPYRWIRPRLNRPDMMMKS